MPSSVKKEGSLSGKQTLSENSTTDPKEATSSNPSHRWVVQAGKASSMKLARFSSMLCQFELPKYVGMR